MNNYESKLIDNKKQQLSKEFYAKMEEAKQNINLFTNTKLNENTSKNAIAYLVVENAKLIKENQQLKKQKDDVVKLIKRQLLSNTNITKYTDEMCLRHILRKLGEKDE